MSQAGSPHLRWLRAGSTPAPLVAVIALVTLCSWPVATLDPGAGLDPSWRIALHMAVHERLDAGTQVVFTYGPLGFLSQPLFAYTWTTRLAFAAFTLTQFAMAAVVVLGLRRVTGSLVVAALGAVVVVVLADQDPLSVAGLGLACAVLADAGASRRRALTLAALAGALGGYALLVKLNTGAVIVVIGAIAVLGGAAPRRARGAAWALGLVAAFAAGWIATGQAVAAVPDYVRQSLQVVTGYSEAMGQAGTIRAGLPWLVAALTALGVVAILAGSRPVRSVRTLAWVLLWLVFAFASFKAGFVRQDAGHVLITLGILLASLCALPLRAFGRPAGSLLLLAAVVACVAAPGRTLDGLLRPVASAKAFVSQASLMPRRAGLAARIALAQRSTAGVYAVNLQVFDAVRTGGVHVDPAFASLAWATGLRWQPLPVFQTYVAYTKVLDDANADALSGRGAPSRILRHSQNGTIDQRNPDWDSPAAMRAMLCHYRELASAPGWQALGKVADRCGAPRLVRSVRTRWGDAVAIPRVGAGEYSWVAVDGAAVGGAEAVRSTLLRAGLRSVTLDGERTYRAVPDTLRDGLVVSVPRGADFGAGLGLDQGARTVAIGREGARTGAITLRFYAARIR